jgi:hypothetical protein
LFNGWTSRFLQTQAKSVQFLFLLEEVRVTCPSFSPGLKSWIVLPQTAYFRRWFGSSSFLAVRLFSVPAGIGPRPHLLTNFDVGRTWPSAENPFHLQAFGSSPVKASSSFMKATRFLVEITGQVMAVADMATPTKSIDSFEGLEEMMGDTSRASPDHPDVGGILQPADPSQSAAA